jgi:hypothetical protein
VPHAGRLQPAGHSPVPSDRPPHRASYKVMYTTEQMSMRGYTVSGEVGLMPHAGRLQPAGHSPVLSDRPSHRASNKVMYTNASAWLHSERGGGAIEIDTLE